jgi:hypothetical protein
MSGVFWSTSMAAWPSDAVVHAALRWLVLLQRSTLEQASALIRADPVYTDLSATQYAVALEWLRDVGALEAIPTGSGNSLRSTLRLHHSFRQSELDRLRLRLFERGVAYAAPAWLPDADILVRGPSDLPDDALAFAAVLSLTDRAAFRGVQRVQGKIDLELRAGIGAAGELQLVELLENRWPGSTSHVALESDGFGYDVVFWHQSEEWHLEVKTTTRRGRLVVYLSRHEFEVALDDPNWRLVVVGLSPARTLTALATADLASLAARLPADQDPSARWESVRIDVSSQDLRRGLGLKPGMPPLDVWPVLPALVSHARPDASWLPPGLSVGFDVDSSI